MEKKNIVIFVAGQRFSISTTDSAEYVMGIGEKIDVMIKGIQKDNPKLNRDACAILTALNFCDDETKLRQMMEVLREQVKDYLSANEKLRTENDALKKELRTLKESLADCPKPAASTEAKADEKNKSAHATLPDATPAQTITKQETTTAPVRQTAFVGKNFSSDNKNKKHNNKHNKPQTAFIPVANPAPAATVAKPDPTPEADNGEDNSPYHQFSIFDDLI